MVSKLPIIWKQTVCVGYRVESRVSWGHPIQLVTRQAEHPQRDVTCEGGKITRQKAAADEREIERAVSREDGAKPAQGGGR